MSEEQEAAFDIETLLDSIEEEDGVKPTSLTTSHFIHAQECLADLKKTANYPFVGPCKLDLRQRWGLRMNLVRVVRAFISFVFFSSTVRLPGRSEGGLTDVVCILFLGGNQLAKYQYESYLMDPFLEEMVSILVKPIRKVVHDTTVGELKGQQMNEHGTEAFYMLYLISKTRGYKTIGKQIGGNQAINRSLNCSHLHTLTLYQHIHHLQYVSFTRLLRHSQVPSSRGR
jgi:hypothetical protein